MSSDSREDPVICNNSFTRLIVQSLKWENYPTQSGYDQNPTREDSFRHKINQFRPRKFSCWVRWSWASQHQHQIIKMNLLVKIFCLFDNFIYNSVKQNSLHLNSKFYPFILFVRAILGLYLWNYGIKSQILIT